MWAEARWRLLATLLALAVLAAAPPRAGGAPELAGESATESAGPRPAATGPDPHSFARFNEVRSTRLAMELEVDFDSRRLRGRIVHEIERRAPGARSFLVDTRGLEILAVTDPDREQPLSWHLGEPVPILGAPLSIELAAATTHVAIDFSSGPEATGLQWLSPQQTAGKRHPFLFSQAQAIHARSFLPVQDSPAVRTPYEAVVHVPEGLRAVMSANNDPDAIAGPFHFSMPQPIPAYLIALAVGELAFEPMSERTGIYGEPAVVQAAAREFADTERMMQVSEALFGPYRWGRYDLLILPPSFPFGGMENPRLSFITPTVIAGDRSLVALIAHELAHSWSGNLVTNASWRDLWLNEGFTVHLEARIMEAVYGTDRERMESALGFQALRAELAATWAWP